MSLLNTGYNSQGAGANYAFMTMGEEDDLFYEGATGTQWRQSWEKVTPHHSALILQHFQNGGLGKNGTCHLNKTPDLLHKTYVASHWPALRPNVEMGVADSAWANVPALWFIKNISFKIGTQVVFQTDGHQLLALIELFGLLDSLKESIGFSMTKAGLYEASKRERFLLAPMVGLPFHDRASTTLPIGVIAFHQVTCEILSRPPSEMFVNSSMDNSYMNVLPLEIKSNAVLNANSVDYALATTCVWVGGDERLSLIKGYSEIIFKEHIKAADQTIAPSLTPQRLDFELNVKGPCTYMIVTIQSHADLDAKNHTKLCQDNGEDYISEMMVMTASIAREDGLPAVAYRTIKPLEVFKCTPSRHYYVFPFETDSTVGPHTGHQNMTNADKVKFSALYNPHSSALQVRVDAGVYNGVYTERGSGGKIWG